MRTGFLARANLLRTYCEMAEILVKDRSVQVSRRKYFAKSYLFHAPIPSPTRNLLARCSLRLLLLSFAPSFLPFFRPCMVRHRHKKRQAPTRPCFEFFSYVCSVLVLGSWSMVFCIPFPPCTWRGSRHGCAGRARGRTWENTTWLTLLLLLIVLAGLCWLYVLGQIQSSFFWIKSWVIPLLFVCL